MDLFNFANPIAHADDPATSREAGERVTLNGSRARHAALVLELVKRMPGSTAVELWSGALQSERDELGEMQEVRRRLTDLDAKGLVSQGPVRHCRVRGSRMVTWGLK